MKQRQKIWRKHRDRAILPHVREQQHRQHVSFLTLGTPAEVAGVEPERAVLHVSAAAAHRVDALVAQLGVGRRAPHLELPLLPVLAAPSARFAALVPRVPRDTWFAQKGVIGRAAAEGGRG